MNQGWLAKYKKLLLVATIILILVVTGLLFLPIEAELSQVQAWLKSLGIWSSPAFIAVYILATVVGIPAAFLMLAAGTLFGFLKGTVVVSIADTLGATICYLLGRTIARKSVKRWMTKRPQFIALDRAVEHQGWKIVLLTRLSPLVPSNILNYGFSLTKINFWHYLFCTWLGMIPVICLYVYLGYVGGGMIEGGNSPAQLVFQSLGLGITIGAAIYTTKLAKNTLNSSMNQVEPARERIKNK